MSWTTCQSKWCLQKYDILSTSAGALVCTSFFWSRWHMVLLLESFNHSDRWQYTHLLFAKSLKLTHAVLYVEGRIRWRLCGLPFVPQLLGWWDTWALWRCLCIIILECCVLALTVDYLLTRSSMRSCLNMSPEPETTDKWIYRKLSHKNMWWYLSEHSRHLYKAQTSTISFPATWLFSCYVVRHVAPYPLLEEAVLRVAASGCQQHCATTHRQCHFDTSEWRMRCWHSAFTHHPWRLCCCDYYLALASSVGSRPWICITTVYLTMSAADTILYDMYQTINIYCCLLCCKKGNWTTSHCVLAQCIIHELCTRHQFHAPLHKSEARSWLCRLSKLHALIWKLDITFQ